MNGKIAAVSALVLALVGFAIGRYTCTPRPPTELPPLPPDVVTVEVVKTIEVPGPYRVVERLKLVTETVEVPVEKIKEVAAFVNPIGRVRIEAKKFEGLQDGKPTFGWKGRAICEFAPKAESLHWTELVEGPIDLTQSKAESTISPGTGLKKIRLDLGLGLSTRGPFLAVGLSKRLTHRSRLGSALGPDWFGVAYEGGDNDNRILATLGKEW